MILIKILQEIAKSETHSYTSLAKTLTLDQEMVRQMFYELQRMGYIITDDPACGDDKCDECGVCCTKKNKGNKQDEPNTSITRWKLTEKGKEAAVDRI